nr:CAP domain-containing protein [Microbacterium elymi]
MRANRAFPSRHPPPPDKDPDDRNGRPPPCPPPRRRSGRRHRRDDARRARRLHAGLRGRQRHDRVDGQQRPRRARVEAAGAQRALDAVAARWAQHMVDAGTISHNPNLAAQAPGGWLRLGENVAMGYGPEAMERAWMASPDHRANILGDYTAFGVAYLIVGSSTWGVQVFAKYATTTKSQAGARTGEGRTGAREAGSCQAGAREARTGSREAGAPARAGRAAAGRGRTGQDRGPEADRDQTGIGDASAGHGDPHPDDRGREPHSDSPSHSIPDRRGRQSPRPPRWRSPSASRWESSHWLRPRSR